MSTPVNATQLGREIGVSKFTVLAWLDDGIISAVINEGRVKRFDVDEVRAALAKRAAAKQLETAKP